MGCRVATAGSTATTATPTANRQRTANSKQQQTTMSKPFVSPARYEMPSAPQLPSVRCPGAGTSGGIGAAAGTVVVATEGVNGLLEPVHSLPILGERVDRPAVFDAGVGAGLAAAAAELGLPALQGRTMGCGTQLWNSSCTDQWRRRDRETEAHTEAERRRKMETDGD